jgi:putative endonuclease
LVILYVLKGETVKRYIGITNDLPRRLWEHRSRRTKGSQLLGEFVVLHKEEFPDYGSARKREKFLKSGQGRQWLDQLQMKSESAGGG